ncbi:MAG TPA: hypothetical protein DCR43_02620 [Bacteroidales bacterium]|nr:hypothetical protein [Bacteroidales bacterium]HBZ67335.1 hypothetical protein [Bacteroidales bacterium]
MPFYVKINQKRELVVYYEKPFYGCLSFNFTSFSSMSISIGIRHEDRYAMERRVALTPRHITRLVDQYNLDVQVEKSTRRFFSDQEYIDAGAKVVDTLERSQVIFGVKEMPVHYFESGKTYVFFSHVIKGQVRNMPMVRRMMDLGCNLIDYEKIVDEQNRRIIFFGHFAGLAGTINTLWTLGLRLKHYGYETPFLKIKQAHTYNSLDDARNIVSQVGAEIAANGLPPSLIPFVIGFTGNGNVSKGAQELLHYLPTLEISPEKLLELQSHHSHPANVLYKVVFQQQHLAVLSDQVKAFDLAHYYAHPDKYCNAFEKYIPHLSVLVNGMYWDERFPRLITREYLKAVYASAEQPKLKVIGDITCDPNGSVEANLEAATVENPIYSYNPDDHTIQYGYTGQGLQLMAVDILPSELPREASEAFGDALLPYVRQIATADYSESYDDIDLPRAIKKALILLRGEFTPAYKYLEKYI